MKSTAIGLVCATTLLFSTSYAQNSAEVSDAFIEGKLISVYTLNEQLDPFNIDIESKDGVVTLKGTVENEVDRNLAVELARSVEGVASVDDQIQVDPNIEHVRERSGFANTVRNATVTAKIKSQLLWNDQTDGLDIQVNTRDGQVTLEGVVASDQEAAAAENIARNTTGVRNVVNNLTVNPEKSTDLVQDTTDVVKETAQDTATVIKNAAKETAAVAKETAGDIGRATKDTWISTKVKTLLIFDRRFDDTDVDVETDGGMVTLTGSVNNDVQKQELMDAVSNVKGVSSVQADSVTVLQ